MTNRAVCSFFAWLEQHGIGGLVDIEPFHVAAYIKALKVSDAGNPAVKERAAARPTVKQHLAAIRMLRGSDPRDYRDDRVKGVLLVVSGRDQSGADAGVKADLLAEVTIYALASRLSASWMEAIQR